ncbi:MAG TPA: SGNH/GDSL hydrolase family protein [Bacteroidia bacterium]|jgi:lysophospholipase L1-like esterase
MKSSILSVIMVSMLNVPLVEKAPARYVALGDSYTIGTGTTEENSWPVLLTEHLRENKVEVELVANPSRNGWTTRDVITRELPVFESSKATFVTLLIGVNDWVQGVDAGTFQKNLVSIIEKVQAKLPVKSNLVLITIPDFGVTETGARYSGGRNISEGIATFNKIIIAEANKRNLKTVDLFLVSKEMGKDRSLVAADGLHPSSKEYAVWEKLIYPVVYELLK